MDKRYEVIMCKIDKSNWWHDDDTIVNSVDDVLKKTFIVKEDFYDRIGMEYIKKRRQKELDEEYNTIVIWINDDKLIVLKSSKEMYYAIERKEKHDSTNKN